ncbi:hypothetical protein [Amycolatopsis thermophila]|uniref:Flagellar motility protein MotE (MotC chaperone) n=1 Tax=Amycolatopsis thermophila TaxID=206084 RepID=A0ABU0ERP4_9PSEU|nr:hypothetical protein [Amycolatopsis thermophila]MDQ0377954.1 flagellar motility protein MotE (MotC chaperone) [Amycolatopsis thermophila]
MDLSDLGPLPTYGGAGILLVIIAVLTRLWLTGEKRHADEINRMREAHAAEFARINDAHDAELAEVKADVAELREKYDALDKRFDDERELRRRTEDQLAAALRQIRPPDA